MVKSLTCSTLHTREITLPNCKEADPKDCERVYHIVLPRILCHSGVRRRRLGGNEDESDLLVPPHQEDEFFEGTYKRVGTLPLVFALHAFKEDARSMEVFTPFADASHFFLVLPEGKEFSFNGGDCCGAARHNGVNDVAFLTHLKEELNREFHQFLDPRLTYGIGWNNGAFLLTYASQQEPTLFRAIVPIAGYTHQLQQMANADVGIMMHYSLDDTQTRPSGCCDNPNLPQCNGEVMSDWCVSILQFFDLWAREVNQCSINDAHDGFDNYIDIVNNGLEYTFSHRENNTVFELTPDTVDNPQKKDTLFETELPMKTTYHDKQKGVTCLTVTSPSCVSNSTLCLYTEQGDFRPTFAKSFFMYDEVMHYIGQDACRVKGGELVSVPGQPSKTQCACPLSLNGEEEYGGTFCFDALNDDGTFKPKEFVPLPHMPFIARHQTQSYVFLASFVAMFIVVLLTIHRIKKGRVVKRKNSGNSGRQMYDHCDQYRDYLNNLDYLHSSNNDNSNFRDFNRKETDKVSNVKQSSFSRYRDTNHMDTDEQPPFVDRMNSWEMMNEHEHPSPIMSNIIKMTEMAELKRSSEREAGDSIDSSIEGDDDQQAPWLVFPESNKRAKKKKAAKSKKSGVGKSLLHVINAPTSYLDSSDKRLLRQFRNKQKEDEGQKAIIGPRTGVRNSLIRKDSEESSRVLSLQSDSLHDDSTLDGDQSSLEASIQQIEASEAFIGTLT